jgi:hypothetical protein
LVQNDYGKVDNSWSFLNSLVKDGEKDKVQVESLLVGSKKEMLVDNIDQPILGRLKETIHGAKASVP